MPPPNKRLQRTGISVSLIYNLSPCAVVTRPLKRMYSAAFLSLNLERKNLNEPQTKNCPSQICILYGHDVRFSRNVFAPAVISSTIPPN